jgi:hypothetical protein
MRFLVGSQNNTTTKITGKEVLVILDLLPSLWGIPWVLYGQAPKHFVVELRKPYLVPSGLAEQE